MENKIKANSSIYKQIGDKLKQLRIHKGVSQQEIANCLMIDRSTYAKYELGISVMNYERLCAVADYFSTDFNSLFCYSTHNTRNIPCMPNDTVYVIACSDKKLNKYTIKKLIIYAVIVKENEILLTCNGSGYYQWTLNEDAFLNFKDAQQKVYCLK